MARGRGNGTARDHRGRRLGLMIVKSDYKIPPAYLVECDNVDDFLSKIYQSSALANDNERQKQWIFRGQPARFNLTPSAYRGEALSNLTRHFYHQPSPADQILLELRALRSFLEAADRQGIIVPGDSPKYRKHWFTEYAVSRIRRAKPYRLDIWPDDNGTYVLTFAQQSGLPTRLLDWTKRSYFAAYFAATGTAMKAIYDQDESEVCDDMAVWAFSNEYLSKYRDPRIEIIDVPTAMNQNLVLQRGCFTLVRTRIEEGIPKYYCLEEAAHLNDKAFGGTFPIRKYILRSSERKRLMKRLSECEGIDGASMFNGINGAMKYLKERAYWYVT